MPRQLGLFSGRGHAAHAMHVDSLQAFEEERAKLSRRSAAILQLLNELAVSTGETPTDRVIKDRLGLPDMDCVRPRITELIQAGLVVEVGRTTCPVTGKTVRMVAPAWVRAATGCGLTGVTDEDDTVTAKL